MKFSLVFLLLLDVPLSKGQQRIKESEEILLRLSFHPFYNSYAKSCCKFHPRGCYKLLDTEGYTSDFLRGRVAITRHDGWVEFRISNAKSMDGGYYRCMLETVNAFYNDYYVEVSEAAGHHIQPQPPLTTTSKAPDTSETPPGSAGPFLAEDHADGPGIPWSFLLPLAAIASTTFLVFVTSLIALVCCRLKAKREQSSKHGETPHESLKQEVPEMSCIVYTTVDFKPHQEPTDLYANLEMHRAATAAAAGEDADTEHDGMVEYSTLAIKQ